ncbi:MAG: hypothetical protein ABIP48_28435 [Planctomycetota bacterium]
MSTATTTRLKVPAEPRLDRIRVSVDRREGYPLDLSPMISVIEHRPTADYGLLALPRVAAIEYKGSVADLARSVGCDRGPFENELQRMVGFPVRALVLACTWPQIMAGGWRADVSPASVRGSLISWSMRYGLPIWVVGNPEGAAEIVREILHRVAKDWWRQARSLVGNVLDLEVDGDDP